MKSLGLGIKSSGLVIESFGPMLGIKILWRRIESSGFGVESFGFRIESSGLGIESLGFGIES